MNKCIFIGRIGGELELKDAKETKVLNFSLAVRRKFTKDGQPDTDWLNMTAFGKTAEFIAKWFGKGSEIALESHVQVDHYEKDGQKRTAQKYIVDGVEFTAGSKDGAATEKKAEDSFVPVDDDSDSDLPF
jgi:single-strand DNA-binding protein